MQHRDIGELFLTYIVICNVQLIWKRWNTCFINMIHVFSCLWVWFSKAHNFFFWNFNENVKSELRRIFLPHLLKFGIIFKPEVLKLVLQIWIHDISPNWKEKKIVQLIYAFDKCMCDMVYLFFGVSQIL